MDRRVGFGGDHRKYGRFGRYRIDKLIAQYGPEIPLPDLRHGLAQCPRRGNMGDLCQVSYVDKFRRSVLNLCCPSMGIAFSWHHGRLGFGHNGRGGERPMRRRDFLSLVAGMTWPLPARAQDPIRVIGILASAPYTTILRSEASLAEGLKESGFMEGKNIRLEWRCANGEYNRLQPLAIDLVNQDVAVLIALDAPAAAADKAATKVIPVVFATGADPVKLGLVDSISRPGGDLTGVWVLVSLMGPKRLEVLHELLPSARTIVLLVNPMNRTFVPMSLRRRQQPKLSAYS